MGPTVILILDDALSEMATGELSAVRSPARVAVVSLMNALSFDASGSHSICWMDFKKSAGMLPEDADCCPSVVMASSSSSVGFSLNQLSLLKICNYNHL